jgi:predicted NBD/HSP70 family sugar kinase
MLSALRTDGPMTRSDATAAASLARSAAGKAVDDLQRLALLRAGSTVGDGTPGRPSATLEIVGSGAVVIACVLSSNGLDLAVVDLTRTIKLRRFESFNASGMDPADTLARIARTINEVHASLASKCVGVGISVPGVFDPHTGVARAVLPLGWRNIPMAAVLDESLPADVPVLIAHDATLGALAEFRMGAGRGAQRLLYLAGQQIGVGSALILADEQSGRSDHPLQAGHLIVDPAGPQCSCGSRGCLELLVDGRAIMAAMGAASSAPSSMDAVLDALSQPTAVPAAMDRIVDHLQVGLISLVNTLSPDRVVFAGTLSPLMTRFKERMHDALEHSVVAQIQPVTLVGSTFGDAQIFGAAELAFEPLLRDPEGLLEGVNRATAAS